MPDAVDVVDAAAVEVVATADVGCLFAVEPDAIFAVYVDGSVEGFDASTGDRLFRSRKIAAVCGAAVTLSSTHEREVWIGRREKQGVVVLRRVASSDGRSMPVFEEDARLDGENDIVTCMSASSRSRVVTHGTNGVTVLWDVDHRVAMRTLKHEWSAFAICLVGPALWCSTLDGAVLSVDLGEDATREITVRPPPERAADAPVDPADGSDLITSVLWVPSTEEVWLGAEDGTIEIWDPWTQRRCAVIADAHAMSITALATASYLGPCHAVWSASADGHVLEWDARLRSVVRHRRVADHESGYVSALACTPCRGGGLGLWFGGTLPRLTGVFYEAVSSYRSTAASRARSNSAAVDSSPQSPSADEVDPAVSKLLLRIEELETDLMRSREVYHTLEQRIGLASTSSVRPAADRASEEVAEFETMKLQLQYYEKRLEELENQRASHDTFLSPDKRALQNETAGEDCERDPSVPRDTKNSDRAALEAAAEERDELKRALRLLEGRFDALQKDCESLELKADDYKHIAKEATVRGDQVEVQFYELRAVADRLETELVSARDQLSQQAAKLRFAEADRRAALSDMLVLAAEKEAVTAHVESLYESVDCLHEDIGNLHAKGRREAERWSTAELAAVEGMLLENDSMRLQLRLLEQMLATQHRQLSVASRPSGTSSGRANGPSTNETLTSCFLALREVLDTATANDVVLEALGADVHDEAHAVELLVKAMARRVDTAAVRAKA